MSNRIPGPICSSKLGSDWIDEGTLCRSQSSAGGPLGMLMSMVMAADPPPLSEDERALQKWRKDNELEKKQSKESLERDTPNHIKKCIAKLAQLSIGPRGAWRSSQERDLILKKLEALNKANMIKWLENIEDGRGGHDRGEITVAVDLHWGNWDEDAWMKSAPVLVHEGTHAVWNDRHFEQYRAKWNREHSNSCKDHPKGEALIAEEMYAWENELKVYEVLVSQGLIDITLAERLKRVSSLETVVREAYSGWISLDGFK